MHKPLTWSLGKISLKCSHYWQSVLLFGLPVTVLYRGIDYAIFRLTAEKAGLLYPWSVAATMDVPLMLLVSAIWWGLMRQIAAWKRKDKVPSPPPNARF
jgi:hypothetical protein